MVLSRFYSREVRGLTGLFFWTTKNHEEKKTDYNNSTTNRMKGTEGKEENIRDTRGFNRFILKHEAHEGHEEKMFLGVRG